MATARPPKIDPPRLARVAERPRISALLDEVSSRAAVWIAAHGGSGKTTAVATWLARRRKPGVWMRLDSGDTHVATFLEYFEAALAAALPRRRFKLPVYSKEAEGDIADFARRYFRAMFSALPEPPPAIVFDDLHDLPESSPVHTMLATLCEECPAGVALFFLSRAQPHAPYLKLATYGSIEVIGARVLDFTQEELAGALIARGIALNSRLAEVHAASGGWIAGALLLSMREGRPGDAMGLPAGDSEALFDFFAGEAFAHLDDADRNLLLHTAFLRDVHPAAARALSGDAHAAERLDRLARQNLFTEKHGADEPRYRYHDLFRAFLRRNAARTLDAEALRELKLDTAAQLSRTDEAQDAIALLVECRAWGEASAAILRHVEPLLSKGRHLDVIAWLRALPESELDTNPWLHFWLGQCLYYSDEGESQACLERAFARFDACDDAAGRLASAIAIPLLIRARYGKLEGLEAWFARIEADARRVHSFPSPYVELKILAPLLYYATIEDRIADFVDVAPQRILALVDQVDDPNLQLDALREIVIMGHRMRRDDDVPAAVRAVERLGLLDRASPVIAFRWTFEHIVYESIYGSSAAAQAMLGAAQAICDETGLKRLQYFVHVLRLEVATDAADLAAAERALPDLVAHSDPAKPYLLAALHGFEGRIGMLKGDGETALAASRKFTRIYDELGVPLTGRLGAFLIESAAHALCGDMAAALAVCRRFREGFRGDQVVLCDIYAACLSALDAVRRDSRDADALLADALGVAREQRFILFFRMANTLAQELCSAALRRNIETEFVISVIRRRRLAPPSVANADWPWPLKVRCLGRFEIEREGKPVANLGKQQKTLQLLQALVASGGRDVPIDRLIDPLWPGEKRVGQQQAFDTTLHRLRKLLGSETALNVAERKLSLNEHEVWVDAMSLASRLDAIEAEGPLATGPREFSRIAEIVALYRGHFLGATADEPWALAARERLWDRMRRLLLAFAGAAGEAGEREQALRIYHFIADLDPLAEDAFLELMRHFAMAGRKAEALRAYERCASALATELGSTPSGALQALAMELRDQP